MENRLKYLCDRITEDQINRLQRDGLSCECNINNAKAHYHVAKKYTRVDIGGSGRYMVVNDTGEIFGIKAYGVIHRGHQYGTLETVENYFWGNHYAVRNGNNQKELIGIKIDVA